MITTDKLDQVVTDEHFIHALHTAYLTSRAVVAFPVDSLDDAAREQLHHLSALADDTMAAVIRTAPVRMSADDAVIVLDSLDLLDADDDRRGASDLIA